MHTHIQSINFKIRNNSRAFVEEKMQDCLRALGDMNLDAVRISVVLEQSTVRHLNERESDQRFRAEAHVTLPGPPIHVQASASELDQAVVKLKHVLTRELRHYRERRIEGSRRGARRAKNMPAPDPELLGTPPSGDGWTQPLQHPTKIWEEETDMDMLEEDLRDLV